MVFPVNNNLLFYFILLNNKKDAHIIWFEDLVHEEAFSYRVAHHVYRLMSSQRLDYRFEHLQNNLH